jgi:GHMP kinases N terminal domain
MMDISHTMFLFDLTCVRWCSEFVTTTILSLSTRHGRPIKTESSPSSRSERSGKHRLRRNTSHSSNLAGQEDSVRRFLILFSTSRISNQADVMKALLCVLWSAFFLAYFDLCSVHGLVIGPIGTSGTRRWQNSLQGFSTDGVLALKSAAVRTEDPQTTRSPPAAPQTLTLFSPCKINLFLRIIGKREDGYHDLASLFQAIGFGDTLELSLLPSDEISVDATTAVGTDVFTCNMPGVPVDSSNLVLRALELMRRMTGIQRYFQANLIKQVPAQAGLGGGSANAATAMWAANELMGNPASLEDVSVTVKSPHLVQHDMRPSSGQGCFLPFTYANSHTPPPLRVCR